MSLSENVSEPAAAPTPSTGASVAERLAALDQLDTTEHPAVYDQIHQSLRDELHQ